MRRGNTLISLLAVVVIIALLAIAFMKGGALFGMKSQPDRPDGKGKTLPGRVMAMAKDDVCMENLRQLRMSIGMIHDQDPDEHWPANLEETRLGSNFYHCDLGKEPYDYNPETGQVKCVHPGHEKY